MKRLLFQRFVIVLLAVCFTVSAVSASYHACPADKPAPQQQKMAGMDCHDDKATSKAPAEKKCCVDFSCPKCFSTTFAAARANSLPEWKVSSAQLETGNYKIPRYSSDTPERPPKQA
jgi:hypothetical protein